MASKTPLKVYVHGFSEKEVAELQADIEKYPLEGVPAFALEHRPSQGTDVTGDIKAGKDELTIVKLDHDIGLNMAAKIKESIPPETFARTVFITPEPGDMYFSELLKTVPSKQIVFGPEPNITDLQAALDEVRKSTPFKSTTPQAGTLDSTESLGVVDAEARDITRD